MKEEAETTKEERKEKASEYMTQLKIYKPYIKDFKIKDWPCYYERFAGFWAWQDDELSSKMKEIEEKYNCTVYAVTHEYIEGDEMYSMLVVTDHKEDWDETLPQHQNKYNVFAYVWNKSYPPNSEFGLIQVESLFGGIRRIA